MITKSQFAACFSELKSYRIDELWPDLERVLKKYEINTPNRIAAFLATVGHESGSFNRTVENLNYSAAGLMSTFPKYFTPALASAYERNPKAIANRVYANRMGNGDEKSGDGWTFRGSGFMQQTGRKNIGAFALAIGKSLMETVEWLKTIPGAMEGAGWYWKANGLNAFADANQITRLSAKVNTGNPDASVSVVNGLADRKNRYFKYQKILGA